MSELKIGDKAPNFKGIDQSSNEISLEDFQGKWVILYFYPKDNTPGCTQEACDFRDFSNEFKNKNAVIIGVSPDSVKSHQKFITKYELPFSLIADTEKEIAQSYGVWALKKMYGKEYFGIVRSTFLIDPKGEIAQANYKVRVKGHVEKVLSEIP